MRNRPKHGSSPFCILLFLLFFAGIFLSRELDGREKDGSLARLVYPLEFSQSGIAKESSNFIVSKSDGYFIMLGFTIINSRDRREIIGTLGITHYRGEVKVESGVPIPISLQIYSTTENKSNLIFDVTRVFRGIDGVAESFLTRTIQSIVLDSGQYKFRLEIGPIPDELKNVPMFFEIRRVPKR